MKTLLNLLIVLGTLCTTTAHAQLRFENGKTQNVDFDRSVTGVNKAPYAGMGRSANLKPGQLHYLFWAANGKGFAGANASGSYAAGILDPHNSDLVKGGFYAAEPSQPGNRAFAYCPASDRQDAFDFRIQFMEDTDQLFVSFDAFLLQQHKNRRIGWEAYYAIDPQGQATTSAQVNALEYKPIPTLNILDSSPAEIREWSPLGNLEAHIVEELKADDALILRFRQIGLVGAGGNRTTVAIDNLQAYQDIPEPATYALIAGLLSLGLHRFKRRPRKTA